MRYLFGFLCVCALGVVPLVGCSETGGDGGSGGSAGTGGMGGDGGTGGDGAGSTTWRATTTPPGGGAGSTGGCTVFVTALNTDISLDVTITLHVAAAPADSAGGIPITTGWTLKVRQLLLPTLGNSAEPELGGLAIAAVVTAGAVKNSEPASIGSALTGAATGQLIGAFTTGDILSLATPGEITAGIGVLTSPPFFGPTFNFSWSGEFYLYLTLGGEPFITIDESVCTFDVQGDDIVIAFDGGAGGAGGAGGG